ncbi:MAG: hypothetical protein KC469_02585 [Flavobacteriaceae bacterium]|nr:hypothetical protein [Flavobacteriaceae bacterium]
MQTNFGGQIDLYTHTKDEIEFAEHTIKNCPELAIYARVAIFNDNNGLNALAELELIEPELW